jgi:hypothetical protein
MGDWSSAQRRFASVADGASISCELGPDRGVRGCTGSRGEDGEEKEERCSLTDAGIERARRQGGGAPTKDFLGLGASRAGRKKRRGRSSGGLL